VGGFAACSLEQALAKEIEHVELGKQRLNRVTGAGDPCRGKAGVHHVFITHALTEKLKQFPALTVVEQSSWLAHSSPFRQRSACNIQKLHGRAEEELR